MAQVRVYNHGFDPDTGIGELLHTTSVRHAFGMIRREVANPVELTFVRDRIVPTALELTRELSGAWVEGAGQRSVGFSYRAVHERDRWTCAYCRRGVSKTPPCEALLATVDHILPVSRGGPSSWTNLVSACKECNNRKADRTPEEARMPLRVWPYDPALARTAIVSMHRFPLLSSRRPPPAASSQREHHRTDSQQPISHL